MAKMFPPSIKDCTNEHYSEIEMYMFLKYLLPDNYYVFWNIRVENRYPDFIILEPSLGIIVLEVKDWAFETISATNDSYFTFKPNNYSSQNPLAQARNYSRKLINLLKQEKKLLQLAKEHQGKVKFCYTYGVVFTNIKKNSFLNSEFNKSIDQQFILFKDEIESIEQNRDINALEQKLQNMFVLDNSFTFDPLSQEEINIIRGILIKDSYLFSEEKATQKIEENIYYSEPSSPEYVSNKKENKAPGKSRNNIFIKRMLLVSSISFIILITLPQYIDTSSIFLYDSTISKAMTNFIEKILTKTSKTSVQVQANEDLENVYSSYNESQPVLTLNVGNNPQGVGTYILIKDGKNYLINKTLAEGSIVEFFNDKKVIIYDIKSDQKEFDILHDVIDLEIGNAYTKIFLQNDEHKYVKYFKYDFINNEIITGTK